MAKKNNVLTVFAQIISNRKADSNGNPTTTSCWDGFSAHADFLFNTGGFGSTDTTQNLAGPAIMALNDPPDNPPVTFPSGTAGEGPVTADDFTWIASVIALLDDAGVWVEPVGQSISYNTLQSISFNILNKQNRGPSETTEATATTSSADAADDSKATYY